MGCRVGGGISERVNEKTYDPCHPHTLTPTLTPTPKRSKIIIKCTHTHAHLHRHVAPAGQHDDPQQGVEQQEALDPFLGPVHGGGEGWFVGCGGRRCGLIGRVVWMGIRVLLVHM